MPFKFRVNFNISASAMCPLNGNGIPPTRCTNREKLPFSILFHLFFKYPFESDRYNDINYPLNN